MPGERPRSEVPVCRGAAGGFKAAETRYGFERTLQPLQMAIGVTWIPDGRGLFLVGSFKRGED